MWLGVSYVGFSPFEGYWVLLEGEYFPLIDWLIETWVMLLPIFFKESHPQRKLGWATLKVKRVKYSLVSCIYIWVLQISIASTWHFLVLKLQSTSQFLWPNRWQIFYFFHSKQETTSKHTRERCHGQKTWWLQTFALIWDWSGSNGKTTPVKTIESRWKAFVKLFQSFASFFVKELLLGPNCTLLTWTCL